jgi:hypothetical protein
MKFNVSQKNLTFLILFRKRNIEFKKVGIKTKFESVLSLIEKYIQLKGIYTIFKVQLE